LAAAREKLPPTNALAAKKILSRVTKGVKGTVICQCTHVSVHVFRFLLMDEPYLKAYLIKMTIHRW
jgi:hypothetical protein